MGTSAQAECWLAAADEMAKASERRASESGARGTRTPDLLGAIQALSQLSYSPRSERDDACVPRGKDTRRSADLRWRTHERQLSVPTHVSFRGRLTLFFLLIVVLPMIAVAVLVTQIVTDSTNGKVDARLAE